jgi:hypothetical protein
MGNGQPRPYEKDKEKDKDASNGDPLQTEESPPPKPSDPKYEATWYEALDRRTIRQAIMTQLLSEIADEIIKSGKKLTKRDKTGKVTVPGDLGPSYDQDKSNTLFPLLRALITDPELEFNKRRNKLFVIKSPQNAVKQPFGSINLVVFRNAMAISENVAQTDPEEVAKRVVIRAGRSGNYSGPPDKYNPHREDRGFAGCK